MLLPFCFHTACFHTSWIKELGRITSCHPLCPRVRILLIFSISFSLSHTTSSFCPSSSPPPSPSPLSLCMLPFLVAHSEQDYHFAPCVASISLWSGKGLDTQPLPIPSPKLPPPEPPSSPSSKKDQLPPLPEPEERTKQRQVEDKYNTRGGCRLILGSSEGSVRIFESSTRVSRVWGGRCHALRGGEGA